MVTSFFPLFDFARKVGGDRVEVVNLVPAGVEPHDWEPRPGDVRAIDGARVFIYNGAGLEPWLDRVLGSLENRKPITVEASKGIPLLDGDPHVWLDPVHAQTQVRAIAAALAEADPAGRAAYEANAGLLIGELQRLDREYAEALGRCARRDVVISHAFFAYPAQRYGLRQVPVTGGLSPEAEPTPKQVADLARFARERGVRAIFFETLVSDRLARTLAAEVGAEALVLNPIEGLTPEEEAAGKDVPALIRENLASLKRGLDCR